MPHCTKPTVLNEQSHPASDTKSMQKANQILVSWFFFQPNKSLTKYVIGKTLDESSTDKIWRHHFWQKSLIYLLCSHTDKWKSTSQPVTWSLVAHHNYTWHMDKLHLYSYTGSICQYINKTFSSSYSSQLLSFLNKVWSSSCLLFRREDDKIEIHSVTNRGYFWSTVIRSCVLVTPQKLLKEFQKCSSSLGSSFKKYSFLHPHAFMPSHLWLSDPWKV